jgi:Ca-activated chloride channel homolog
VTYTHPEAFWLLATLPVVWAFAALARRTHARWRLGAATLLRSLAIALAVAALAQPRTQGRSDAVSVVYAIDVSRSVSPGFLARALDGIRAGNEQHRPAEVRYVVFADRAKVVASLDEVPRVAVSLSSSPVDAIGQTDTDIEQALRTATGSFGAVGARRLVLISDGNQTRGDLWRMLPRLQSDQVRVFTVPAEPAVAVDAWVDAIEVPDGVRQQSPAAIVVKVHALTAMRAQVRLASGARPLGTMQVSLQPGENGIAFDVALPTAGATALRATVRAEGDLFAGNDAFETSVQVGPRPRVLYVEGVPESARHLADALRTHHIDVTVVGPDDLPREMSSVAAFDAVILSDVLAQSLDGKTSARLEAFVRDEGGGFVFVAGESTHGEDGLAGSVLERLLPVRFEARRKKRDLDLVLLIDRSHSMRGRKLELAKTAALSTLDLLEARHRLAVVAFDSQPHEVVPLAPVGNKRRAEDLVASMTARGQTSIHPALVEARRLLRDSTATTKHVILLSDGITAQPVAGGAGTPNAQEIQALIQKGREEAMRRDGVAVPQADAAAPVPEPGAIEVLVAELAEAKITVSTVALGDKPNLGLMGDIAAIGGGRAYVAGSDAEIPGLFVAETRRLLGESLVETAFQPVVAHRVALLDGIDFPGGPPLRGMVAVRAKTFADVLLQGPKDHPLLVTTHYGLGRTVAFLSDAKNRWAADWIGWDGYGRLWAQVVRDAARPFGDDGLSLRVTRSGGEAVVELRALGPDRRHRNGLAPLVRVTDPRGGSAMLALQQVAPGRYAAQRPLEAGRSQPYRFDLAEGGGLTRADVRAAGSRAIAYPWSDEFRALPPDLDTLRALGEATGGGFAPTAADIHDIRGDGTRVARALWPWCVSGSLLAYLLDLVVRRAPGRGATSPGPAVMRAAMTDRPSA